MEKEIFLFLVSVKVEINCILDVHIFPLTVRGPRQLDQV